MGARLMLSHMNPHIAGSVILLKLLCFTRGTNKYQEKVRIHTGKHQARAQSKNIDYHVPVTPE
jgi:hypothetical protein